MDSSGVAVRWSAALSCWIGLKRQVRFHPVPWRDALRHLRPCAVLFLSVIAVQVYRTMDKVMVGAHQRHGGKRPV